MAGNPKSPNPDAHAVPAETRIPDISRISGHHARIRYYSQIQTALYGRACRRGGIRPGPLVQLPAERGGKFPSSDTPPHLLLEITHHGPHRSVCEAGQGTARTRKAALPGPARRAHL